MKNATKRYVVRFAVHLSDEYRTNFLAELSEDTGATTREVSHGRIEITDFRSRESGWVLDALNQEQNRGALIIEDSN